MNSKQRRLDKYKMIRHATILGALQGAGVNSYGWIWMQQSRAGGSEKLSEWKFKSVTRVGVRDVSASHSGQMGPYNRDIIGTMFL